MSLIKQAYEVSGDFKLKALIYGQPGLGKSTAAISAPNAVLIDCDNGVHRIAPNHRVPFLPVKSYDEVLEVIASKDIAAFDTIVIDTAGKLLDYMAAWIIKNNPKMGRRDGALTQQGYGVRKYEFINLLKAVCTAGKHLIFVAHEKEEKDGDIRIVRPEIGGSSGGDLIKELDLVGYMEAVGRKRTISFSPSEKYYAKNSARLPDMLELPELANGQPNDFMAGIIKKCQAALNEESGKLKEYNELIAQATLAITQIKNEKDANKMLESLAKINHIWDSKIRIWELIKSHAAELKLTFDGKSKKYAA